MQQQQHFWHLSSALLSDPRDIKLENVLLVPSSTTDATKPPIVKLCDFGCARTVTFGTPLISALSPL